MCSSDLAGGEEGRDEGAAREVGGGGRPAQEVLREAERGQG